LRGGWKCHKVVRYRIDWISNISAIQHKRDSPQKINCNSRILWNTCRCNTSPSVIHILPLILFPSAPSQAAFTKRINRITFCITTSRRTTLLMICPSNTIDLNRTPRVDIPIAYRLKYQLTNSNISCIRTTRRSLKSDHICRGRYESRTCISIHNTIIGFIKPRHNS